MKTKLNLFQARMFCAVALGIGSSFSLSATAADSADTAPAKTSIPWSQLGAKAGADYKGEGLAVIATAEGARLRCAFQKLEGEATPEGLWLTSTVIPPSGTVNDRFRILAAAVGRELGSVQRGSLEGGALVQRCDALTLNAPLSLHAGGDDDWLRAQPFRTSRQVEAERQAQIHMHSKDSKHSIGAAAQDL